MQQKSTGTTTIYILLLSIMAPNNRELGLVKGIVPLEGREDEDIPSYGAARFQM